MYSLNTNPPHSQSDRRKKSQSRHLLAGDDGDSHDCRWRPGGRIRWGGGEAEERLLEAIEELQRRQRLARWPPAVRPPGRVLRRPLRRKPVPELPFVLCRPCRDWHSPPGLQARPPAVLYFTSPPQSLCLWLLEFIFISHFLPDL